MLKHFAPDDNERQNDKMSKFKQGSEEWYIEKGTLLLKICCFAFLITAFAFWLFFIEYFTIFKYIFICEMILNAIIYNIAINMIMKFSFNNRYDFFAKYDRKSVDFKARNWVIIYFLMMIVNLILIIIL